jgi:hypothetical protein
MAGTYILPFKSYINSISANSNLELYGKGDLGKCSFQLNQVSTAQTITLLENIFFCLA